MGSREIPRPSLPSPSPILTSVGLGAAPFRIQASQFYSRLLVGKGRERSPIAERNIQSHQHLDQGQQEFPLGAEGINPGLVVQQHHLFLLIHCTYSLPAEQSKVDRLGRGFTGY